MVKTFPLLILSLILVFVALGSAQNKVTSIKLNVFPKTATIRPLETAVIQTEFYGKKKKGWFGGLFGNDKDTSRIQSNDWKVSLSENSGWISKPFLFQDDKKKTGVENFLQKTLGTVANKDSILYTAPSKPGKYIVKISEGNLKKQLSITVSNSAPSSQYSTPIKFDVASNNTDPYFHLVEHYAPFIAQETWFNPRADFLTRFDFDGNWKGDDNWENLSRGSSQAFVYYAVMETKTHWFLQYNFFHARDYSDVCIAGTCHENDNEGVILTVRKDDSKYGKLEVLETLAHNNIYSFSGDNSIKNGVHNLDGKIDFYKGSHPIVFIEAGGHGVLGSDYKSSFFSAEQMDFKQNTGVTYMYTGKAERPKHANDRNVGYALLPIYEEWWSKGKHESNEANETFDNFYVYRPFGNRPKASAKFIAGAFKGRTASNNKAKPFWAWHDRRTRKKRVLNTGQWALDPAYAISKNLKFPKNKPVSTEYIFNPYLESNVRVP